MELGSVLPVWSAIPFVGVLLSIALFPLLAPVFWHRHFPKVSAVWSAVLVVPFVLVYGEPAVHELAHVVVADYVPFIILIATLFTIGGGGFVRGPPGRPPPPHPARVRARPGPPSRGGAPG